MKSKPVEYFPAARLDVEESAGWYEEKEPGVGQRFQAAVELVEQKLQRNPLLAAPHRRNTRKWRVKRFPHSIIYREEAHRIVQCRRRPCKTKGRLLGYRQGST